MFELSKLEIDNPDTWDMISIGENEVSQITSKYLNKDFGDSYYLPEELDCLTIINDYLVKSDTYNQYMRYGCSRNECFNKVISNVSSILELDDFKTEETLLVYRGCRKEIYELMLEFAKNEGLGNDYLVDLSFISTSLIKGEAFSPENGFEGNIMLRILLPKGSRAFYVGNLIGELKRHEVLLPSGSQFRIVSRDDEYINCILE